jgi:hypothetical protein
MILIKYCNLYFIDEIASKIKFNSNLLQEESDEAKKLLKLNKIIIQELIKRKTKQTNTKLKNTFSIIQRNQLI